MSYPQRIMGPPAGARLTELLEAVKQEFDSVNNEASVYRMHKDEFDLKFNQQTAEMQQVRQTVYELEMSHRKMKERYEEEILHLKRELETANATAAAANAVAVAAAANVANGGPVVGPPPPTLTRSNVFGGSLPPQGTSSPQPGSQVASNSSAGQGTPNRSTSSLVSGAGINLSGSAGPATPAHSAPLPPASSVLTGPVTHLPQPGYSRWGYEGSLNNNGVLNNSTSNNNNSTSSIINSTRSTSSSTNSSGNSGTSNSNTSNSGTNTSNTSNSGTTNSNSNSNNSNSTNSSSQAGGTTSNNVNNNPDNSSNPNNSINSNSISNSDSRTYPKLEDSKTQLPALITKINTNGNLTKSPAALGNNLGDLDVDSLPPKDKKIRDDWFVVYNALAPAKLDVEMVQSLDHHSVVCCVRFSTDGKYVATGCNRSAQIFLVATGELVCRLQDDSVEREGDLYIRSVCFSPDGEYLVTGAEDKQIRVWDIARQTIKYLFSGHEQDIYSLDFSLNGRHIASGSGDRTVRMWDMESGQCVLTLSIEDGVTTVAISPDGHYVAAGSLDKTVRVWDTTTGFLVERLEVPDGHNDSVYSVAFSPSGKDLVSGSLDKTIRLWELQAPRGVQSIHKGGVCVRTLIGHKDFVLSVAATPDGNWIISGSKDRGVQFWDPATAQVQLMLQGHKNSVISVAPSPIGQLFATGSGDCRARIWRYYPRS